jgi:CheY-like chemotaxis protein
VDDDVRVRETLVAILRAAGLGCRTAANGAEALDAVAVAPPDLILLDIHMPVLDGLETCRRLKATPASAAIPVIALTGQHDAAAVLQTLDAGSFMYLSKPVTIENLLAAVRLTLGLL